MSSSSVNTCRGPLNRRRSTARSSKSAASTQARTTRLSWRWGVSMSRKSTAAPATTPASSTKAMILYSRANRRTGGVILGHQGASPGPEMRFWHSGQ